MKKNILLSLLGLLVVIFVIGFLVQKNQTKKTAVNPLEPTTQNPVPVDEPEFQSLFDAQGDYKEVTEYYEISIDLPVIENQDIKKQVYTEIENSIKNFKKYFEGEQDIEMINMMKESGMSYLYSFDVTHTVFESPKATSYVFNFYEFTGGAHGNPWTQTMVFSKESFEELSLEDFLVAPDNFDYLKELALKTLTVDFPEGFDTPEIWNTWYVDGEEFVFVFDPYAIAAYAVGTQELRIPLSDDVFIQANNNQ